ncbi:MAG: AtpZ/AtpI family protein [Chitinophagaceae bacterium]|nr:AtpZ/AtpI family protein [Chitinophagaceae bacterium]
MSPSPSKKTRNNNSDLRRYAGLTMQLFAGLALGVFIGMKADEWLRISFPVFVWVLPLAIIVSMIYKLIKETGARK